MSDTRFSTTFLRLLVTNNPGTELACVAACALDQRSQLALAYTQREAYKARAELAERQVRDMQRANDELKRKISELQSKGVEQ